MLLKKNFGDLKETVDRNTQRMSILFNGLQQVLENAKEPE